MPDREKVIKGLEVCFDSSKECNGCPYIATPYCKTTLRNDVTALLKEQEPRVMTLDELKEIYVEFKGNNCLIRLTNFDVQKIIMYADDGVCRLWTGEPTDEQRKAVKWE